MFVSSRAGYGIPYIAVERNDYQRTFGRQKYKIMSIKARKNTIKNTIFTKINLYDLLTISKFDIAQSVKVTVDAM